jgi:hypothetical protein
LIDWQNAFDRVNKQINSDHKRNWYRLERQDIDQQIEIDQRFNTRKRLGQVHEKCVKIGRGIRPGCCLSSIPFNYAESNLIPMHLKGLETSK